VLQIAAALLPLAAIAASARADIFQWEYINPAEPSQGKRQSTTLAPGGAGVDAAPGADLHGRNLMMAYLIGADLHNASFFASKLTSSDLSKANLANADFLAATLTGADLDGADVRGADFSKLLPSYDYLGTGLTPSQLYSTASYQAHDLTRIRFGNDDLSHWNFAGQNLTNSSFGIADVFSGLPIRIYYATLTGADFSGADARGAFYLNDADALTVNLIRPDGHIGGVNLDGGGRLVVRDYDGNAPTGIGPIPITIDQHLAMSPGGTLRMVFEADAWDSTISFAPGIPVALGGTLELTFASDVNLAGQVGRTLDLFDWIGVNPTGTFNVQSDYSWDTTRLYTTGEITLTAIPEPATLVLLAAACCALAAGRRGKMGVCIHRTIYAGCTRRSNSSGLTISSCGKRLRKSRPSGCDSSMRLSK
jgi:hypothetical protein